MALLQAMSHALTAPSSMAFTAVATYESPSSTGPPLAFTTTSEVLVQRPNRLRVIKSGDGRVSEYYFDGKTLTAFAPSENLVAVMPAPATIDAMLEAAFKEAAILGRPLGRRLRQLHSRQRVRRQAGAVHVDRGGLGVVGRIEPAAGALHDAAVGISEVVLPLAQVKVGDMVDATYMQSVVLDQLPDGAATKQTTMVSNIWAIDQAKGTVMVRGPLGHFTEVELKDPAMLNGVKVGDQMKMTITQAIATSVVRKS